MNTPREMQGHTLGCRKTTVSISKKLRQALIFTAHWHWLLSLVQRSPKGNGGRGSGAQAEGLHAEGLLVAPLLAHSHCIKTTQLKCAH